MAIIDLRAANLWAILEQQLNAADEHVCALPMRTYIKPVRVITLLQTDTVITSSEAPCPPGSTDIKLEAVDEEEEVTPEVTEPETCPPPGLPPTEPIKSTFETDDEGWRIVGDGVHKPTFRATGGTPGGVILGVDRVLGGTWFYRAPAKFLGNQSSAFGNLLSYRLWTNNTTFQFNWADVRLVGGGLALVCNTPRMRAKSWHPFAIPLDASGKWRKRTLKGALATDDEVKTVLANMTGFFIRGEFNTGADRGALSNVIFGAKP